MRDPDQTPTTALNPTAPSWDELTAQLPLCLRVQITDGMIDGLTALHQAIYATGSGAVTEMLCWLTEAVTHLTGARDALVAGIAGIPATPATDNPCPDEVSQPTHRQDQCTDDRDRTIEATDHTYRVSMGRVS
jgi:hypothetical protein